MGKDDDGFTEKSISLLIPGLAWSKYDPLLRHDPLLLQSMLFDLKKSNSWVEEFALLSKEIESDIAQ